MSLGRIFGITDDPKSVTIYKDHDDGRVILYDGTSKFIVEYKEFRAVRENYLSYNKKPSISKYIPCDDKLTMEETYRNFIHDADILKKETNGFINLYKSGTESQTALHAFARMNTVIPEKLTMEECEWIHDTTHDQGVIMFGEPYQGEIWKYDIISAYWAVLADNHMLFPVKQGQFETIKEFGKDHHTAIYRCTIEQQPAAKKLFRYNNNNKYTSIDVRRARELNLKITLIVDDMPNVLYWDRSRCMTGAQLFGKFIKYMFDLKKRKVPRAKLIGTRLWGALIQQEIKKKTVNVGDPIQVYEGNTLHKITHYGDQQVLWFVKNNSLYKYDWARIGPFVYAKGRSKISKLMEPFVDDIVRSHTDSIWATKKIDIETGTNLGNLRYEGYCPNAAVINTTKYTGRFFEVDGFDEYMKKILSMTQQEIVQTFPL